MCIHITSQPAELFLSLEIPSSGPESQNATASITFSNEFARDFSINVSSLISENITIAEIGESSVTTIHLREYNDSRDG